MDINSKSDSEILEAAKLAVEKARSELKKREDILQALLEYAGIGGAAQVENVADAENIDVSKLPLTKSQSRGLVVDSIKETIEKFGDQEFVVAHVESALQQVGKPMTGNSPRAKISSVLKKLERQGFLKCTFVGGGNVPNKYVRNHEPLDDEHEPDIDAMYEAQREAAWEEEETEAREEEEVPF